MAGQTRRPNDSNTGLIGESVYEATSAVLMDCIQGRIKKTFDIFVRFVAFLILRVIPGNRLRLTYCLFSQEYIINDDYKTQRFVKVTNNKRTGYMVVVHIANALFFYCRSFYLVTEMFVNANK
uniref:Uncharacterized protein n=1 Tax=Glossina brevipalpis TaxID=37001 RepID=A0A1A9WC64_9MUSC